jgi:hypothetical protein
MQRFLMVDCSVVFKKRMRGRVEMLFIGVRKRSLSRKAARALSRKEAKGRSQSASDAVQTCQKEAS